MTVRESYSCFRAGSSASLASLSSFPPTSWFLSFHPEVMNPLSLSLSLSLLRRHLLRHFSSLFPSMDRPTK